MPRQRDIRAVGCRRHANLYVLTHPTVFRILSRLRYHRILRIRSASACRQPRHHRPIPSCVLSYLLFCTLHQRYRERQKDRRHARSIKATCIANIVGLCRCKNCDNAPTVSSEGEVSYRAGFKGGGAWGPGPRPPTNRGPPTKPVIFFRS